MSICANRCSTPSLSRLLQGVLFLAVNLFFVCKYFPRAGLNPLLCSLAYVLIIAAASYVYYRFFLPRISEKAAGWLSFGATMGIVAVIAVALCYINPLSVRVDRWSATTYFLDALFQGIYPYGVHTHVSDTNFPSPFPLWHYMNLPFWLMGDVGWQLVFFLLLFAGSVYYYFRSWKAVLTVLLLLFVSPAYWWEVATRSDGLSNALLVCSFLLYVERRPVTMKDKAWLLALLTGCLAATRLSAIIPLALYLFYPWLQVSWQKKVAFLAIVLGVVALAFAPYVFWNTDTWVFFSRNPFMSQTEPGNKWLLLLMVLAAIVISCRKHTFYRNLCILSVYMFLFMLISQVGAIWNTDAPLSLLDDRCDISYFTLAFPYCLCALAYNIPSGDNPPQMNTY